MAPKKKPAGQSIISKFQKFETITIARKDIQGAPYNPRKMSAKSRDLLKKKIQTTGLVEPLVYNKRSGYLVGGHQRLSVLDTLEGGRDYSLTVAVVDLSPDEEKETNIFLNNSKTQGEWDLPILKSLFEGGLSVEGAGFELTDMSHMFEGLDLKTETLNIKARNEIADDVNKMLDDPEPYRDNYYADFYVTLVFGVEADYKTFLKKMGMVDGASKKVVGYNHLMENINRDFEAEEFAKNEKIKEKAEKAKDREAKKCLKTEKKEKTKTKATK